MLLDHLTQFLQRHLANVRRTLRMCDSGELRLHCMAASISETEQHLGENATRSTYCIPHLNLEVHLAKMRIKKSENITSRAYRQSFGLVT